MSDLQTRMIAWVEAELRARADETKAPAMAAYMKTEDPFFGVTAPGRKEVLRGLVAQFAPESAAEYEAMVRALYARPHRETRYLAIDVATRFKGFIDLDMMGLYEHLIRAGGWWDFVDPVAVLLVGGVLRKHRDEVTPVMREWIDDDDMWIRRSAILSQNRHREDTDQTLLFELCLRRMHEREFFIRKAIGWALRELSYADPEAVITFLEEHREEMSGLSYREGAKRLRRDGLMD